MKTIKLKSNGLGRYVDVSPFTMSGGRLEMIIVLPEFNGEFFFIAENNKKSYKQVIPESGIITLDGLTAGELAAEIKHYVKGSLIKTYKVEPLVLCEADGNLTGTPEITLLKAEIDELRAKNCEISKMLAEKETALNDALNRINEKQIAMQDNICALIRFAYKDYVNNVYLDGGNAEEFVKEFGFGIKKEQINAILGGKENE